LRVNIEKGGIKKQEGKQKIRENERWQNKLEIREKIGKTDS
jgi:hypothetical protein